MSQLVRCFSKKFPLEKVKNILIWSHKTKRIFETHSTVPTQKFVQSGNSEKIVGKWLLGCSGMVYAAVTLGGVTRLTESGLSMVSWKFLGEHMPRSREEWENEFLKYQQFPEYKMKNMGMTLREFQFIYMMEYIHRMWGRAIGVIFLVPAMWFWSRGYFNNHMKKCVILLGSLLGFQGLMGWYMVKSGLEDRFKEVNDVPRVSQYRLASHLAAAFALYAVLFSTALSKLSPAQILTPTHKALNFRRTAMIVNGLIFLTAISGAFVAGLDAGLVYNSFPKMGDDWIPNEILSLKPIQRNFTENPVTVQFDHRILGITTTTALSVLWLMSRRTILPRRAYWSINAVCAMAWIQASLGATTLLTHVPVSLAAAHQSGSLLLLSFAIWLSHELRYIKYIPK